MAKKMLVEKSGVKVNLIIDGKQIKFPVEFTEELEKNFYIKKFIREGYLEILEEMNEKKESKSKPKRKPSRKHKSE